MNQNKNRISEKHLETTITIEKTKKTPWPSKKVMSRMLLKHSYPLNKHTVGLLRSFAEEKAPFLCVGGRKNTLLLKSQSSIIVNRSQVRRYLCISCFGILVFVFGSVWEVEWVVGRDKCQSVGLRKQSLLLPRQLPPLTPRATNPQGSQHNLCTDHPCCQVSGRRRKTVPHPCFWRTWHSVGCWLLVGGVRNWAGLEQGAHYPEQ